MRKGGENKWSLAGKASMDTFYCLFYVSIKTDGCETEEEEEEEEPASVCDLSIIYNIKYTERLCIVQAKYSDAILHHAMHLSLQIYSITSSQTYRYIYM